MLILLNGPPASGKSTLSRRFADDHPATLDLDIDQIRRQFGGWRENPHRAGLLARATALDAAREHLATGADVIVPQFLARPDFVEQLAALADESTVEFREALLLDDKARMLRRFADRSTAAAEPAHAEAADQVAGAGGASALAEMYDRLLAMVATRPATRIVRSIEGDIDGTYQNLIRALAQRTIQTRRVA